MGNILWQEEAAEFIEQYPQRRRPPHQMSTVRLRQSASAGTLYRKPESAMPILNKRASGGELLTTQQRHQRDLFSGDLGIPDVNSHVGSMVHTFENMALQRKLAEKQREQREREHSKYLAELMAMQAAAQTQTQTVSPAATSVSATTTTTKRTFIPSTSGTHSNNSKFQQLRKKTHETRQKIIQQILQNHPMHKDVTKMQSTTPRFIKGTRQASSNSEVYYRNIEEDYRKNLFGTIIDKQTSPQELPGNSDIETTSFCDEIVAQAFDEIFEGYSGLEDEEEIQQKTQPETSTFFSNTSGPGGLAPKQLPAPLSVHKKSSAPPPPRASASGSPAHTTQHKSMPFSQNQQKSSSIHNIFERLKPPSKKIIASHKFNKTSLDSLINPENILSNSSSQFLHKFPNHLNLNREVEGQESSEHLDQDFLRGSTVSQSFVRHLKVHQPNKGKAPPIPVEAHRKAKKQLKTSEALRQVLLFSKKSRSSDELMGDNISTIETRKYYRRLDDDAIIESSSSCIKSPEPSVRERRVADGCSGLENTERLYAHRQAVEI